MKSIEDLLFEKLCDMINFGLSKIIKPDITIDKVTELDENQIKELKQKYGIEGIILDVDETLRKDMKKIPKVNQEWIEKIGEQLKVIILSNGIDKNLEKYFEEKGIGYISFAHKPLKKNFIKACEELNINPEKMLTVGDSVIDDVLGGKINKMKTALVRNVEDEER